MMADVDSLVWRRGEEGLIDHVEIDTAFHMGNFPMVSPPDRFWCAC